MNWLTNFVRPKIRALVQKENVPDNLWRKCTACEKMVFHRDLAANLFVCTHCGHHMRIGADLRLKLLFDGGNYTKIELPDIVVDPLKFKDQKRYIDRLKESQSKTGHKDAIVVAHGKLGGMSSVLAAFDFGGCPVDPVTTGPAAS